MYKYFAVHFFASIKGSQLSGAGAAASKALLLLDAIGKGREVEAEFSVTAVWRYNIQSQPGRSIHSACHMAQLLNLYRQ